MEWCFVITVSEWNEEGESHIQWDSIWLDEEGSYRRIMQIVEDYSRSGIPLINETITSRRGIIGRPSPPHYWTWESEGGRVIVSAERCKFGEPLIRTINPITLVDVVTDATAEIHSTPKVVGNHYHEGFVSGVGVQTDDTVDDGAAETADVVE